MKKQTLFMETTEVPADRSAAEISSILIQAGATQIATDYDAGKVTGLRWVMNVSGMQFMFAMPARVQPMYEILLKRAKQSTRWYATQQQITDLREKAERVAWRQLLRWTQAQLAMIQTGMVKAEEIFLPYMQEPNGKTVYQLFSETRFKALPPPEVQ